ncbi:type I polyketide synthase, partial [Mycolicibacterium litorale]|uniref:type I polyketide synthase n=1 Tax=Mycolicibacterium litorale TaxID=758802 RepID=UPI003CEAAB90
PHHHSTPTLQRHTDETLTFHTHLNTLQPHDAGHPPEPHPVLPATPWQHVRHWATIKKQGGTGGSAPKPGTLLGEHIGLSTAPPAHLWQARVVPESKPYPGGHRIRGVEVVPVSVLLQTLSLAAAEAGATVLSDISFEHPIVLDRVLLVQVVADGESVTLSSTAAQIPGGRWVRHASARLSHGPEQPATADPAESAGEDLADYDMSALHDLQRSWGVEGQPFAWSVTSCRQTPAGVRADVSAPQASTAALLDAAVHLARLADGSNTTLMVPSAIGRLHVAAGVPEAHGSVEVRRREAFGDAIVVDITVTTPQGATWADIRSLRYTALEPETAQRRTTDTDPRTCAHAIDWRPWSADADPDLSAPSSRTVAVVGSGPAARGLREALSGTGLTASTVADARCVVYVAEPFGAAETDIDCAVRMSGDVTDLVRTLAGRGEQRPATLWIVTRGVREADTEAAVRQSCLWGLAGVIGAEHSEMWGGLVDLPSGDDPEKHAPALSRVLSTTARSILALRDGEFFAPALEPVCGQPVRGRLRCRPDAAYLVTGGMGVLGLLAARWLADRGARRLILAGRTALPPRNAWDSHRDDPSFGAQITAIRELELRGVSVEAVALDVGSRDAVQALLDQRDRHGAPPIRGVIHGAGVTENRLLSETARDMLQRVMWPKVAGAQSLHEAFPAGSLDFFFLTASAGTVFGVPGQGAYAAANAYLDGLARARRREGCHTMSLDWVAWRGLGFASDAHIVTEVLDRFGSRPIEPEEAFTAWDHAQRYDVAQVVVAPLADSRDAAGPDTEGRSRENRPWAQMSPEDVLGELETGLRAIVADELQMPEADIESNRPFAELGLNSVMAMSIRRSAEELVGIELSATMLWNHPTIASLTEYLANRLLPQHDSTEEHEADSDTSVLDALFEDAESTPAGSDTGR